MFFLPLKLRLAMSSRPKIASRARAVVRLLTAFSVVPGLSLITSSTSLSFGGVSKGTGGYLGDVVVAKGLEATLVEESRLEKVLLEL